jgi:hypothetical protein
MPSPTSFLTHPVDQTAPEFAADQDDRNPPALSRLHQREAFGQLVERAETAGQHDIGRREAHEHHLAREEITKVETDVLELVAAFSCGSRMLSPIAGDLPANAPRFRSFHQSRPAARDHREARIGQQAAMRSAFA